FAFGQDGAPAQAGLKTLQADFLEQPDVVGHRKAPFAVVVGLEFGGGGAPAATGLTVGAGDGGGFAHAVAEGAWVASSKGARPCAMSEGSTVWMSAMTTW